MNNSLLWFSLIFLFLFLEMGHPGLLYFLSFSCGATVACIASWYEVSFFLQCASALVGTIGALIVLYYFIQDKKQDNVIQNFQSNSHALIGKKVVVYRSEQDESVWQTKIGGDVWLVKTFRDEVLHEGQLVTIVDIQGCHVRVSSQNV